MKEKRELDLDTFGEIMDEFLKENKIQMLITIPEGSITPEMKDNVGLGPTLRFYILLAALTTVVKETVDVMSIDAGSPEWEHTVDLMLSLVRQDIMDSKPEEEEKA